MSKKHQLVILDRDGVINEDSDAYIKSPAEWHAIPGSLEAIAKLNQAGIKVAVATNQSGVARKLFDLPTLQAIHAKMQRELAKIGGHIDIIKYCPHHPDDQCPCRKPNGKMLLDILEELDISPENTLFIGDTIKDIQAAKKVGCDAVLVKTGKGERTISKHTIELANIKIFPDLITAIQEQW